MIVMAGCSSLPFVVPDPPQNRATKHSEKPEDEEEIPDFGAIFDSSYGDLECIDSLSPEAPSDYLSVNRRIVRIALQRQVLRTSFYCASPVKINAGRLDRNLQGRITISIKGNNTCRISSIATGSFSAALPCTLKTASIDSPVELEGKTYRGNMLILPEGSHGATVVNVLPVEHYLRGVVPLEIGHRPENEIEAVKAQAVAARTYTYKRILERASQPWDMLPTVSDQVYGGAGAEGRICDNAIKQTLGLVLAFGNTLVHAYYHSTCGGKTANVENVWGRGAQPYLVSIDDVDKNGKAYCRSSKYFTWSEKWNTKKLSSILHSFSRDAFPKEDLFDGTIIRVRIEERFSCGRVKDCAVTSSRGTFRYGTDKIRFAFRRDEKNTPILRSSNFSLHDVSSQTVTVTGRGYGHGVGMCQVGAMGRARAGQTFKQILEAYYPGTRLVKVVSSSTGKE